jgi:hypothetical protein
MSNEDPGDGPGFSTMMIRRHEDMEPVAGVEAPAAESEAREEMTDARRSWPRGARRMARAAVAEEEAAGAEAEAAEAAEGRMLETTNPRKVRPPWLPLPTAACASSC